MVYTDFSRGIETDNFSTCYIMTIIFDIHLYNCGRDFGSLR